MLKAVIFDMDGVLVDSEPVHFAADYKMLRDNFDMDTDYEEYKAFIGSTQEKLWNFYREKYGLYDYKWYELMDMAEKNVAAMVEKDGYPPIKGAADFVMQLKEAGYMLAVASSSAMAKIDRNLSNLGIGDCFAKRISGMELKSAKPEPEIFLRAASELGVLPEECIVIEDSENGVLASKAAGMACLGFVNPNSGKQDLSKADYLFESFESIDEGFVRMVHNHCFFLPWRVMETKRLIIREMSLEDIDDLIKIYGGKSITRYMEGLYPRDMELEYMKKYIENIYGFYGYGVWILEKKDGTVIGRAGLEFYQGGIKNKDYITGLYNRGEDTGPETEDCHFLGYVIGEEHQGQGYAYEACSAIMKYSEEALGINKIKVSVHKDNIPSIKLAKKLGFKFDEKIRQV